jgi:hypothetical protein
MRLKDENSGETYSGILKIPQLRLTSGLSMRLGRNDSAMVAGFSGVALPTGSRGNKKVAELILLSSDID